MIPVIINNRDILESVKLQIRYFRRIADAYIILVDNRSTYPPLQQYYDDILSAAHPDIHSPTGRWHFTKQYPGLPDELHLLPENRGPRASMSLVPYIKGYFDYYFLVEPDLDFSPCDPACLLTDLIEGLKAHPEMEGAGVSLRIDDLPDTKLSRLAVQEEKKHWQYLISCNRDNPRATVQPDGRLVDAGWYSGGTDTAGVMRRVVPQWTGGYKGIRSTKHIARHRPWYFVPEGWCCPGPLYMSHAIGVDGCSFCQSASRTPPDFKHFYEHADPSGTHYTAFVLDKERNT